MRNFFSFARSLADFFAIVFGLVISLTMPTPVRRVFSSFNNFFASRRSRSARIFAPRAAFAFDFAC